MAHHNPALPEPLSRRRFLESNPSHFTIATDQDLRLGCRFSQERLCGDCFLVQIGYAVTQDNQPME